MKSAALIALSLASGVASAAVDCTGTVDSLSLHLTTRGTVTLSLSGGPSFTYLCEVDGVAGAAGLNGVSPAVCRTMYSTLALAKVSGKKVTVRFYDYAVGRTQVRWVGRSCLWIEQSARAAKDIESDHAVAGTNKVAQ
jgi:hypothetical protein